MFKNFKGSHPLQFDIGGTPAAPTLDRVHIGDVFMRHGAVCMRVQDRRPEQVKPDHRDIINLQTGAVWAAHKDDEVHMVRATLTVT